MAFDTWMELLRVVASQNEGTPVPAAEIDGRRRYALVKKGYVTVKNGHVLPTRKGLEARCSD